jgi:peptidoglycan hydrolase-like protein with peptidoglycan-binding domain
VSSEQTSIQDEQTINDLRGKIAYLESLVAALQAQLSQGAASSTPLACQSLQNNLYYGMKNSQEVNCLQQFLKNQGVYPEGLVTGNFGNLTLAAVIRFQEKYKSEILTPVKLEKGTGFVGLMTRSKINQILGS